MTSAGAALRKRTVTGSIVIAGGGSREGMVATASRRNPSNASASLLASEGVAAGPCRTSEIIMKSPCS